MSVRVEWHDAAHLTALVYPPGNDDWVGAADQGDDWVLTISTDEVAAIHGTREQLRAVAQSILDALEEGGTDQADEELEPCCLLHRQPYPQDHEYDCPYRLASR